MPSKKKIFPLADRSFLRVATLLALFVLTGIPTPGEVVPDPGEVEWSSVLELSGEQFASDFSERQDGHMLIDIEIDGVVGDQRLSGIWQKNADARPWAAHYNLTDSQFADKSLEFLQANYRLVDQEIYMLGSDRHYAGIWIKNLEGCSWASHHNLTAAQLSELLEQYKDDHVPIDFEAHTVDGSTWYSGLWVNNVENLQWILRRDLGLSEFSDALAEYGDTHRLHDFEAYQVAGQQRFAAIWIENINALDWKKIYGVNAQVYENWSRRYRDLGYRLTDFERYETTTGTRYAGVWRQNSDRPDWPLRSTIDDIANAHLEENDIPGMGIAIVNQGKIEYMRGFGHQDVANDTWYSAHTINRLASVSKAIAGVLLFKLDDQDQISPSTTTSRYVPGLPSHHTHTLSQLASNRGGIGHYNELGLGTLYAQLDTALQASGLFWDNPLTSTPGTAYKYSTHGYTLLGAAIEGAAGAPIADVLDNLLGNGLGLPTLKAENRSEDSDFRSVLYDINNSPATPDNISWKVLGGGIESSSYDLARFAAMLMSGQILSSESLEQMWSVPNPNNVSYAMGWSVNTLQGVYSVRKDGSQLGANTYLRLFPEMELGIVVLANRRNSEPSALSNDIANAILPTLPPVLTLQPMSETIHVGDAISLAVNAVSSTPLSYQWHKDGVEIPGATSSALALPATDRANAGLYSVVVNNGAGSVTSASATVYVLVAQIVEPLGLLENGGFRLLFGDHDGYPLQEADKDHFTVQWSDDLMKWNDISATSYTLVEGKIVVEDLGASAVTYRYYRVRQY